MTTFRRVVHRISSVSALAGAALLLLLAFVTVADIVGRYAFGKPITGYNDIAGLATAVVVSTFFPILLLRRGNISLEFVGQFAGARARRALDLLGGLVTAAFFGLMTWQYVRYAAEAVASGERMPVMRWPTGPWWWAVTLFMALTAIVGVIVVTSPSETADK